MIDHRFAAMRSRAFPALKQRPINRHISMARLYFVADTEVHSPEREVREAVGGGGAHEHGAGR